MKFKRTLATAFAAAIVTTGTLTATTSPALAVGNCPSGKLCVYAGTDFDGFAYTSTSTQACIDITQFGIYYIPSYVNNLPVNVTVYSRLTEGWWRDGVIRPGGYSSNTDADGGAVFGQYGKTCTGGASPGNVLN